MNKSAHLHPSATMDGLRTRPLLHLTIRNNAGSPEHFYHFLLGYLLPLAACLARKTITDDRVILLRSCGLLDRMLVELALPSLVLCERNTHAAIQATIANADWAEVFEMTGFDFGFEPEDRIVYDVDGIRAGVDFVRRRLRHAIAAARAGVVSQWNNSLRILVVERGDPDPFYSSALAEAPTSGTQRRTIANHAEMVEALADRFPTCCNLKLEVTFACRTDCLVRVGRHRHRPARCGPVQCRMDASGSALDRN